MAKNYSNGNSEKEVHLLERRLIDLSRVAYQRDIITFTDFLNLNEQNILHTLPKDSLYTGYILFGGYASAERQMAAFIPEAFFTLREEESSAGRTRIPVSGSGDLSEEHPVCRGSYA